MNALELKIPPLAVMLLCAVLMYALAAWRPADLPAMPWLAVLVAAAAFGIMLAGVAAFHRHRTTANPHTPEQSRLVVSDGIYRFSRNPMYLGMVLLLAAWALQLAQAAAWAGVAVFAAYITRFQIIPEERILSVRFGEAYRAYCCQTRRWL
ncbi:Putative protein-S-isoprenylcysteine methyltransferase [Kingella potus]|uniref:Steroid 5-alpha reductase C-terminal domain-containing protein n=1 Tax=Kingella potus TaxID=265175 RepID=A0A377R3R2_9NEIS|nr:isoprenylcysteine carboxylmethyltransferase family protein [Kingella potus]UOO99861.1 isoprenylcysteine carboxylmethyltransferase family protein [Kingella potus]STR03116.1 Putative protein-S-isoprenylcysteine methyltransferase [Kingella potus]